MFQLLDFKSVSFDSGNAFRVSFKNDGQWLNAAQARNMNLVDQSKAPLTQVGSTLYPAFVSYQVILLVDIIQKVVTFGIL